MLILVYAENLSSGHLDTTFGGFFIEPLVDNSLFGQLDELIEGKVVLSGRVQAGC
ncbi:MAG: hypothetical protein MZV63_11690 [Marinilabiliales bacterium]|nr:hypothetical protein [Marinilabiliales bacterium]